MHTPTPSVRRRGENYLKIATSRRTMLVMQAEILQNLLFPGRKDRPAQIRPVSAQLMPIPLAIGPARIGMAPQKERISKIIMTAPMVEITPWIEGLGGTQYGCSSFCKISPKGSVPPRLTCVSGAVGSLTGGGSSGRESDGVMQSSKE